MSVTFSYANLYRHYLACRKNKRNTYNALRFEVQLERQLLALCDELISRRYQPAPSVCFLTKRPKLREIFAADFRDRVVHHVLVDYLEKIWEPIFIHDSYACRKGKGVHQGVKRLRQFIHQVSCNGQRRVWYLQLDIANYFMDIDKHILWHQLAPRIDNDEIRWLTRLLVFHDCTAGYIFRGDPSTLKMIPPHKSLLTAAPGKGLPIGNLNSQFFANVYLNTLDQFVKHQLKCRYYIRYCDDFVLLGDDPQQLTRWQCQISEFVHKELLLALNPARERLRPVSDGVDFLGYIVRRDYTLVRRRVVNHLKQKLQVFERELVTRRNGTNYYRFDVQQLGLLHAMLSSYLGHFKRANTHRLWQNIWQQFDFLAQYFSYCEATRKLSRHYLPPKSLKTVRQQYYYFRWQFPDDILFFQVGRYMEFYHRADQPIAEWMGLKPLKASRRGARYGFPISQIQRHLDCLIGAGLSVMIIAQSDDDLLTRIRQRMPRWRVERPVI